MMQAYEGEMSADVCDMLTGLPTRRAFFAEAEKRLLGTGGAKRQDETSYCMLAIDIEHFRFYNKWYGRSMGDQLLHEIGECLKKIDQTCNTLSAYFGADNFYVLLEHNESTLLYLREEVYSVVKNSTRAGEFRPVFGAYLIEDKQMHFGDICDRAASALAHASENAYMDLCWYDKEFANRLETEVRLLPEARKGLKNHEFMFYLQPKCELQTGRMVGAEALARWMHPKRGLVSAAEFIPVMEKNGLLIELDMYVWEEVCKTLRSWLDSGVMPVPISVNVSRADIYAMDVPEFFVGLVRKYDIDPHYVEIEITESAYVENEGIIRDAEEALRAAGFTVLIDDFGSGYSSLNMLKDIQADVLKLDLHFLHLDPEKDEKGIEIIESVLGMARQLKMIVVAEGVETKKQAELLKMLGCEYVQGYYFYKPMPLEDYEAVLGQKDKVVHLKFESRPTRRDTSYLQAISGYFMKLTEVNLDTGEYQFIKSMPLDQILNTPYCRRIEGYFARVIAQGLIHEEDLPLYRDYVDLNKVREMLEEEDGHLSYCYRCKVGERFIWLDMEITASEDYSKKNPWVLYSWKKANRDAIYYWENRQTMPGNSRR